MFTQNLNRSIMAVLFWKRGYSRNDAEAVL